MIMTSMNNHFDVFERLGEIEKQTSILVEEKSKLCECALTDFELVPELCKWFSDTYPCENVTSTRHLAVHRRRFVFLALLLYSPESLHLRKSTPPGLRETLASVCFGVKPCVISNDIPKIASEYKIYPNLRKQLQAIYHELMKRWGDVIAERTKRQ